MTPIEVFEYKNKWMPGFAIQIHSDKRDKGVAWCKQNLEQKSWKCIKYTDVYESTFCFEHKEDAEKFSAEVDC